MLEDIKEWLVLDASSPSWLAWKKNKPHSSYKQGTPAMASVATTGYLCGGLCRKNLLAHRAVFYLAYGYMPEVVDHIDGDRSNNDPDNLRDVSLSDNQHNRRTAKGYYVTTYGTYRVMIKAKGVHHLIGTFKTEEEARAAYLAAKKIHHPTSPINKET